MGKIIPGGNMRLAVFSEKAHNHQKFINRALKTGYNVSVLTPHPEKISLEHQNLHIAEGSVEDELTVHHLLEQADAVICLFKQHTSVAVKNIIAGMERHDIRRCIFFAEETEARHEVAQKEGFLQKLFKPSINDSTDFIRQSDRDWTILYPFDQEVSLQAHHHIDISDSSLEKIKENFASFLLKQITDARYVTKVLSI